MNFILAFLFLCFPCEALQVSNLTYFGDFAPGETKQVKITLINDQNEPQLINLNLCDYWCNSDGQHFFEPLGSQVRSNADWILLNTNRALLAPNEKSDFYFTITAPRDPFLKGSYWSVLLIEPSEPIQPLNSGSEEGLRLQVKIRYAYHIVTNLADGTPKLKIVQKEIRKLDDKDYLCIDVANTGTLFLNPKMILKLYNSKGELEKTLEALPERLYPGSSQRYFLDFSGINGKKFKTFLLLDNGDNKLFGDTFELNFS